MKRILQLFLLSIFILSCRHQQDAAKNVNPELQKQEWAIVIHGGAGVMSDLTPESQAEYIEALRSALNTGTKILKEGGSAMDAVEMTIRYMEDNPLFNAGKGAVFTHEGTNELDASIMDGSNLAAGAVAAVSDIKNPISAARAVMQNSPHVFLSGKGASEFARDQGLEMVKPEYFFTPQRWQELQDKLKDVHGTVGCCALDKSGNLAAGTSTGGMTNKRYNRIGDTPVIGAGTYANNSTCAVSSTGHGEYFIRYTVAHDISALMEYKGLSIQQAAELVINKKLVDAGGSGGVIGVDKYGNIAMTFNTNGMFRAFAQADGEEGVFITSPPAPLLTGEGKNGTDINYESDRDSN